MYQLDNIDHETAYVLDVFGGIVGNVVYHDEFGVWALTLDAEGIAHDFGNMSEVKKWCDAQ